jgi:hypothetical protein
MKHEIVETANGRWMVLVGGFQAGGCIDRSGAGNLTFATREQASMWFAEQASAGPRAFVCGTRKVTERITGDRHYAVVCATCEAGGTVRHRTRESAIAACVRDSGRACRTCGAD